MALTLVIIQKIHCFLMRLIKKDEFGGVIIIELVGLKSKMYFVKKIDGKECNQQKK